MVYMLPKIITKSAQSGIIQSGESECPQGIVARVRRCWAYVEGGGRGIGEEEDLFQGKGWSFMKTMLN